jgi:WD40 repeat protein
VFGGDLVERLPRPPYGDVTSCSIVDVEPSGQVFVACGSGTVELRHAANGGRLLSFSAPDSICAARFSPDGRTLAVGGLDRKVTRYEMPSGRILGATPEMGDTVDEIVWLGTSGRLALASQRGEVWIVDGATNTPVLAVLDADPEYNPLGGICATADGAVLFVSVGERLGAFDTQSGKILWRFDGALSSGGRLTISPRGDVLAAARASRAHGTRFRRPRR